MTVNPDTVNPEKSKTQALADKEGIRVPGPKRRAVQRRLLDWFDDHRRDLPWRRSKDPYRVWISEIMLQQTQVKTVIPYYRRFLRRFPTLKALAAAPLESVLELWSGLGYYRRARLLHEAARAIVERHGGRFPRRLEQALALPGLGRYSAGAVLSIAYGEPVPVVDGNVARVLSRLLVLPEDPRSARGQKESWQVAGQLLPQGRAGDFNEALMELGAVVCTPKAPACPACPLATVCQALREGQPERYPRRAARTLYRAHFQACAIILRRGKALLVRERDARWYRDLWHLPFFEIASSRLPRGQLRQRIAESFGLDATIGKKILENRFMITVHRITQIVVPCKVTQGTLSPRRGRQTQWVSLQALHRRALPASQRAIARQAVQDLKDF